MSKSISYDDLLACVRTLEENTVEPGTWSFLANPISLAVMIEFGNRVDGFVIRFPRFIRPTVEWIYRRCAPLKDFSQAEAVEYLKLQGEQEDG